LADREAVLAVFKRKALSRKTEFVVAPQQVASLGPRGEKI
jgi:hypothetical protein